MSEGLNKEEEEALARMRELREESEDLYRKMGMIGVSGQ